MDQKNPFAEQLNHALPQTQCTKCGFKGCRPYAQAMADGQALHNQCPPGGAEGVARLAQILKVAILPVNPNNGLERVRSVAVIDPALCIGCTLCIQACPTDAIIGAAKQLHSVVPDHCTGCDLCVAPCPVDCIAMVPVSGDKTAWAAWSSQQADPARARYERREQRLAAIAQAHTDRLAQKAALARTAHSVPNNSVPSKSSDSAASDSSDQAKIDAARKKAMIANALARATKNTS